MKPDAEGLHAIANTENPDRKADIVFVHGLGGGSHATWRYGKEGKTGHFLWPEELAKDMPDCGIWTVGYPAGFTNLGKPGMVIDKRAGNLSQKLANAGLGTRPLIFITHSMGGLVVKSLIVGSQTLPDNDRKKIVSVVKGIVFCATPHRGSAFVDAADKLGRYSSIVGAYFFGFLGVIAGGLIERLVRIQPHVDEMRANADRLDTLHDEFIEWQRSTQVPVDSYAETRGLFRKMLFLRPLQLGLVVPRASANPNIAGYTVRDVDDDHLSIVKPPDRSHDVYAGVLRFIKQSLQPSMRTSPLTFTAPLAAVPSATQSTMDAENSYEISSIIKHAPEELLGRAEEIKLLNDAWERALRCDNNRPRVLTFVALGGEGKTSLVAKWVVDLAFQNWPRVEKAFAWSFYNQGTSDQSIASSDLFLEEALNFFGDAETAKSKNAFAKARRLTQLVGAKKAILVLDGLEPLQYSPASPMAGALKDQGIAALLKGLGSYNQGLCVVTTRYSITDLHAFLGKTIEEFELKRLSKEAGMALLRSFKVNGQQDEFEKLVEDVNGHALTLNLFGAYLQDAYAGDIRKRDLVDLDEANAVEHGGHVFRVMDAYVRWFEGDGDKGKQALAVLNLLGLFDRPAAADQLGVLMGGEPIPGLTESVIELNEAQRNVIITRLEKARLVVVKRDSARTLLSLDAHPLLREYFACQLRVSKPAVWRAAHRRLYEYLVETTKEGDQPSIEGLQPLYQAIAHGCQAGMYREAFKTVYESRIIRGTEHYSADKLGAFGSDLIAVTCFFDIPWTHVWTVFSDDERFFLLNEAATRLSALCRLVDALEPLRLGLEILVPQHQWEAAARMASNLCELELLLGNVADAQLHAKDIVTYSQNSQIMYLEVVCLANYADVLHQAGLREEATEVFYDAEVLQSKFQPDYPLLYSMAGFTYCDFLLADAERAAWQVPLSSSAVATCHVVTERAKLTLGWAEKDGNTSLLTLAVQYLAVGRATLYTAILENQPLDQCCAFLEKAVNGFRDAGQMQFISLGLLSRAWMRGLAGLLSGPESAQSDLDEAWEIAARGPMPLFIADIHLHRARLFFREEHYPWDKNSDGSPRGPQDDLAEARRLIGKHGYWRRKEELEDAERTIGMV